MKLITKTCACGCGGTWKALTSSPQIYFQVACNPTIKRTKFGIYRTRKQQAVLDANKFRKKQEMTEVVQ